MCNTNDKKYNTEGTNVTTPYPVRDTTEKIDLSLSDIISITNHEELNKIESQ